MQDVYASEGQSVRAGQLLFRIAIVGANEKVAKAEAAAEQASIDLQDVTTLMDNKVLSNNVECMITAELKGAEADYRLAVLHKCLSLIRASFSGILGHISNKVGSLVDSSDLLTSLSDNSKVFAYSNISETDYLDSRLHPERFSRTPLQLVLANSDVFPASGKVLDTGGQFDSSTGTIAVRVVFNNANNLLRNGQTGIIKLSI